MITRSLHIIREMIPTGGLVIRSGIRVTIGATVIASSTCMPDPVAHWVAFAGKMLATLAVISLFSHAEGVFVNHVADKLKVTWGQMLVTLAAILGLMTAYARTSDEDRLGLG